MSFLFWSYAAGAQVQGASLINVQGCGSATLIGNAVWGSGTVNAATLNFEKQVGTNWVLVTSQALVSGNNYIIIMASDITTATLYRLRVTDGITGSEYISPGVIVNPATWNTMPSFSSSISAVANWGGLTCGTEDDYIEVFPLLLPGGRPPYRIEYKRTIDPNFTTAASEALWTRIYNILPNTDYTVRVTDFCGRVATQNGLRLRIEASPFVIQPTSCNNGLIRVYTSGSYTTRGMPPFTYGIGKYSDTMTTIRPTLVFSSDSSFNNLSPGDYDIQLRDACGNASVLQSVRLGGGMPRLSTIDAALNTNSCTYTATVNVFTGTAPFQYGIKAPGQQVYSFQSANSFPNLNATSAYSFVLVDMCGDTSAPLNFSVYSPPSISNVDVLTTGSSCINDFVVKSATRDDLAPLDYGIRVTGSGNPFVFQSSDTFKHVVIGNYDIVKRNRCGTLSSVRPVTTWINSNMCPLRIDAGDFEAVNNQGCTDFSGNTWIDAKDANGNLVFSINPQGNLLQQVCWGVRVRSGDGTSLRNATIQNNLLNFLDRNFYIQPSVTPILSQPVLLKLYITNDELLNMLTYLHNNGYPNAGINDLRILKKNGSINSPADLEVTNDNTAPSNQFTVITPVFTPFGFNWAMELSITGFSEFNPFVEASATLPLHFISFEGKNENNAVQLYWATSEEVNTKSFIIEWSANGVSFSTAGTLDAVNTPGENHYQFTHTNSVTGKNYYRLKQVDKDGRYTYSAIITVITNGNKGIQVFPNPAQDVLNITSKEKIKMIMVYDASGKKVMVSNQFNRTNTILPVRQLSRGVYWINIVTAQNTHSAKFIKQ